MDYFLDVNVIQILQEGSVQISKIRLINLKLYTNNITYIDELHIVLGPLHGISFEQKSVNTKIRLQYATTPTSANNYNSKKRIVDFTVPIDYRVKLKESEKKDKYLDLARELKNSCNMKVMVILIVNGVLGTVTKGLVQGLEDLEIRGRVENIQTTALLRSARILRKSPWDLRRFAVTQTSV